MTSETDAAASRRGALARERAERETARKRDPKGYRERMRLERLRDLLGRPWWTARDAVYIFAGLHPELTDGEPSAEWGPSWLPGGCESYAPCEDHFQHGKEVEGRLECLGDIFTGEARSPTDWIKRAAKFDVDPTWLKAALEDEPCQKFIPSAWRAEFGSTEEAPSRHVIAARAAHDQREASVAMRKVADCFPDEYRTDGRDSSGKIKRGWPAKFGRRMARRYEVSEGAVKNNVPRWVAEFEAREQQMQNDILQMQPEQK